MLEIWKSWCRFCAKQDSNEGEESCNMESPNNKLEIFNKLFITPLTRLEGIKPTFCTECSDFVTKLESFHDRCLKVDQMFNEIFHNCTSDADLQSLRVKYSIDSNNVKNRVILTTTETEKETADDCLHSDHVSDASDAIDEEESIYVKKEVQEKVKIVHKKRGRPRGSLKKALTEAKTKHTREIKTRLTRKTDEKDKIVFQRSPSVKRSPKRDKTKRETLIRDRAERYRGPRSAREQPSVCQICSKTYTRKYMLTLHMREKHSTEELPFACQSCPKRFVTAQKLKVHEVSHLPKEEKLIHPCPHCEKLYGSIQNVEIHIRAVHKNEKPFICEECGKSFVTKGALKEHHISHTDERSFQCSHCPKKYKSLPRLKMHEDVHTSTLYECPTCGVKRNTKHNLKMHMLVHSEEKKFKCKYCGNEFKRIKSFKDHLIIHTGQRPYECPFCSKTFANGSNCRKHKKIAHPAELAALEASGEPTKVTILPKLEILQAKDCN
ncbi:zinc finger protein 493-like [Lutzomyia longipalpis]|uniref:zinc finger protein 493-like n=1 Tax=Lutzomyia longipalpis TaxID=7200 RepID=UPI002483A443|nr:zinc finger protein 493-like [Lutzomyia longipalpis]